MTLDCINGLFEFLGGILVWINVYKLAKEKVVMGVYWPVTAFFTAWGAWNMFYYPALGQMWSTVGGGLLCLGNLVWVLLAVRFIGNETKLEDRL